MKPVLIINHSACESPNYLHEFLDKQKVAYEKINHEDDELTSRHLENLSGLIILGSPVSANDSLSWIKKEIEFIQLALDTNVPVLGICFGAQLLARAMGAEVCSAASMQIGWHRVETLQQVKTVLKNISLPQSFSAFEWHGDTFSIPAGAVALFNSDCIKNQGFAYKNSLALQFHPEISESMIHQWLDRYAHCLIKPDRCIQGKDEVLENLQQRLSAQRLVADELFGWWLDRVSDYVLQKQTIT